MCQLLNLHYFMTKRSQLRYHLGYRATRELYPKIRFIGDFGFFSKKVIYMKRY